MRADSAIMTDGQRQGVNEGDASRLAFASLQVIAQRPSCRWHQLDEAVVADEAGKFIAQMLADFLAVEVFEGAIAGLLKPDDDGHHFAQSQSRFSVTLYGARGELFSIEGRLERLAEIVKVSKKR